MNDNVTMTGEAEVVEADELESFFRIFRRALLMVVRWIERRYEMR